MKKLILAVLVAVAVVAPSVHAFEVSFTTGDVVTSDVRADLGRGSAVPIGDQQGNGNTPTVTLKSDAGGGGHQFVAQAWDSKRLTWQYKVVPCGDGIVDPNGCFDITDTEYYRALKAQFPQIYK